VPFPIPSPPRSPGDRRHERGSTLLLLAVVLVAGAGLAMLATDLFRAEQRRDAHAETLQRLQAVRAAVLDFAQVRGRLPCPAAPEATGAEEGVEVRHDDGCDLPLDAGAVVPWRSLGLARDQGHDPWGQRLTYLPAWVLTTRGGLREAAVPEAADPYCGIGLTVRGLTAAEPLRDPSPLDCGEPGAEAEANGAAFVVISHGPNGLGGYTTGGTPRPLPTSELELPNALLATGIDEGFVTLPFRQVEIDPGAADYYDDLLLDFGVPQLFATLGLPRLQEPDWPPDEPPPGVDPGDGGGTVVDGTVDVNDDDDVPDFVFTEGGENQPTSGTSITQLVSGDGEVTNAINMGDRDQSGEPVFNDPIILEQGRYACTWVNRRFLLTDRTFVAYFHFLFTQVGPIQEGEGFTFTVLPGAVDVTDPESNCAQHLESISGADLGYVGLNDGGPKFAVEFDMNSTGGPPRHDRVDGTDTVTHVAVLHGADNTYHQPGATPSPSCEGMVASFGGAPGGCTWRPDSNNWLKNPGTQGLMSRALPPGQRRYHTARIEINRRCDPSCTSCNTFGGTHIRLRARLDCPARADQGESYDPAQPGNAGLYCGFTKDTDPDWVRSGLGLSAVGENSLNHCFPEPGGGSLFHSIKVGFTSAADAGNELAGSQILDFIAGGH